ncbi:MAG TPA: PVC-type heme-binding CxxCH protein [Verrucomicrobiales bacterium]|nr:PVC-type heme-binding CxxCH protein [Verrucomicrobiales bacterium]
MRPWILSAALAYSLPFLSAAAEPASHHETGFVSLFDGASLEGWRGEPEHWRVQDGAIVGEIPPGQTLDHNTWLIWEGGELDDFELRLQFRLEGAAAANSGIQFRCQVQDPTRVSGYQADLDMGAVWLGRIYDEHGRALLAERGQRVRIAEDGARSAETFAAADAFGVLYRESTWNDYRIRACGPSISVEINGTLFGELVDLQAGESDLEGRLALQLHSGPETRVRFRHIRYRKLAPGEHTVVVREKAASEAETGEGAWPRAEDGRELNFGFEEGTLKDWTTSGEAFAGQPVDRDGIAGRWPGPSSNKAGRYFIGGYEKLRDAPVGTLTSLPFEATHPFASFLVSGGSQPSIRVEIVLQEPDQTERILHTASGRESESMERTAVDLRSHQGKPIFVRLVDESAGPWGHLNFDDFRFHETLPEQLAGSRPARIQENPILAHLQPNPLGEHAAGPAAGTVSNMWLEPGLAAEVIAAEPDLRQPIALTFDERGRIWIAEALCYPQKRNDGDGQDRILIFADNDADGIYESRTVFAEGLNLVSGIEVGYGGVWIGAAPQLLFIPDHDRDDQPDSGPVALLDGFGFQDTHETLNSFTWGPDGWLYGNQGVFNESHIGKPGAREDQRTTLFAGVWRYHPLRHVFEVFAHGGSNQWGLDFDDAGQLFMTHCRSHFGRGGTTHVVQGGHYWNQANANHAPFVCRDATPGFPAFRNYLIASAPYDHGEGGAGKPGSRRVYGGHSHVGTMIYLGDNWPGRFRNKLFTHNLHGHQINQQENRRRGSGFETLHAGRDIFYCPDPAYIGVDLAYGPDGGVYMIDWVDRLHCHNPNAEHWDRGNGRLYRITQQDAFKPVRVDLASAATADLPDLLTHRNHWFSRTALRLLRERSGASPLEPDVLRAIESLLRDHDDPSARLRALWALDAAGAAEERIAAGLEDADDYVRGWAVQLLAGHHALTSATLDHFVRMSGNDPSPVVRRFLASALTRIDPIHAWRIARNLARHREDAGDPLLPNLLWFGVAQLASNHIGPALRLAREGNLPALEHWARWYGARLGGDNLAVVLDALPEADAEEQRAVLEAVALALHDQSPGASPAAWTAVSPSLYASADAGIRALAEQIGAAFGDLELVPQWQSTLKDREAGTNARRHAFSLLARVNPPGAEPIFLDLLDDPALRREVFPVLARFKDPSIASAILQRFGALTENERSAALDTLTSRPEFAEALLDAIGEGALDRRILTGHHARRIAMLDHDPVTGKLEAIWGRIGTSPEEQIQLINTLETQYQEAPLWAYDAGAGRELFSQLCAACHQAGPSGNFIGPDLTGSGRNGIRYFLENIVDPNAVVGSDYHLTVLELADGSTVAGMVEADSGTALTLRTLVDSTVIPKSQIRERTTLEQSLMPPNLLQPLEDRQRIELLKYLNSL